MSVSHNYDQPNAPNSPTGDSDSDVELDLQELDPLTAGRRAASYHDVSRKQQRRRQGEIPLRNLRSSGLRTFGRRSQKHDNYHEEAASEEDLHQLLENNPDMRDSPGSFSTADDDAPLLQHGNSRGQGTHDSIMRPRLFMPQLRLPSFLSGGPSQVDSRLGGTDETQSIGKSRDISIGQYPPPRFPPNAVSNAKYTPLSFLPRTLYNEFSFFFNMYFLLVALSQVIPPLRIGYLSTYVAPLAFVLAITLGKEALDDIARRRRDAEANKAEYTVLRLRDRSQVLAIRAKDKFKARLGSKKSKKAPSSKPNRLDAIAEEEENLGGEVDHDSNIEVDEIKIMSRDLKVGDVLKLSKDQRVPADLVILKSYPAESAVTIALSEEVNNDSPGHAEHMADALITDSEAVDADARHSTSSDRSTPAADGGGVGETFIRTDQLDGETDWKLRLASPITQPLDPRAFTRIKIVAGKPEKKVNEFIGTVEYSAECTEGRPHENTQKTRTAPLSIDNTAWADTVLASNAIVLAVVVYTGAQTRQAMSTSPSRSKTGLLEYEINNLTKILCALTLTLSIVLVALEGFENRKGHQWYVAITRFLILFSTIIPISLRVNLDMGKTAYAWLIERDQGMPSAVVRTSTIPEELGRIEYLLSDKTGTLTQNGTYLGVQHSRIANK